MNLRPGASLLLSILLCFAISQTGFAQPQATTNAENKVKTELPLEELQMFAQIFGKIKSDYVELIDDKKMLRDAIDGILAGLDPHSSFLGPDAFHEMRIDTEGKFGGVGIEVTVEENKLRVIAPIADTPADRAGVEAGDYIISIDGESTFGKSLGEAVKEMRGEVGSKIVLTISRDGVDAPFDIEVVRDVIQLTSVRTRDLGEPGFAYMRVTSFQGGTAQSLERKIEDYLANNAELKGLILDLRNNPGGVLSSAVDVSDLFLDSGVIVETHGRIKNSESRYQAESPDLIDGAPMVVLVNGGSASASEIVAGALQDHQRAIIFGTQTFGKGSVQTITPVGNGSALKITTARYYTPDGRSIQETGITPDIISEVIETVKVDRKNRIREVDLARHLANPEKHGGTREEKSRTATNSAKSLLEKDSQLRDALNLIKGIYLANSHEDKQSG